MNDLFPPTFITKLFINLYMEVQMNYVTTVPNTIDPNTFSFFKAKEEEFCGLSSLSGVYPFLINGRRVPTCEHLYQALKFPNHPEIQKQILNDESTKRCKSIANKHRKLIRPDWNEIQLEVMEFCLKSKLIWNWFGIGRLLSATEDKCIYEMTECKDRHWGVAQSDKGFEGENHLGKLLMKLRDEYLDGHNQNLMVVNAPEHLHLKFLGGSIQVNDRSQYLSQKIGSNKLGNSAQL
jgi:N-glycosidase YbiA